MADRLDQVEYRLTILVADGIAEDPPEQANLVKQRLVAVNGGDRRFSKGFAGDRHGGAWRTFGRSALTVRPKVRRHKPRVLTKEGAHRGDRAIASLAGPLHT